MPELSVPMEHLLDEALASLSAWHVLEGLARCPGQQADLVGLVACTGLDVSQAWGAIDVLCRKGLLTRAGDGVIAFAREHAADLRAICACIEADRDLQRRVVREAARRDAIALRVSWGPPLTETTKP